MKKLLLTSYLLAFVCGTHAQVIVTAVGGGFGGDGGPALGAALGTPFGVALDDSGNLYICEFSNSRIRKVTTGYGGIITTIAGNGMAGYSGDGGLGIYAQINGGIDVAVDRHGNVYIADAGNGCIRKVTPEDTITTIAGTGVAGYNGDSIPATAAQLNGPVGVTLDSIGNLYIVDGSNYRIRKVDTSGIITTIVGTGVAGFAADGSMADTAKLDASGAIRIDKSGNLFFADNVRIRKMDTAGIITTIAGTGISGSTGDSGMATLAEIVPSGIALDSVGNIYIAEGAANRVRKITTDGIINTIAGTGFTGYSGDYGNPLLAEFRGVSGIVVSNTGDIFVSDEGNQVVRLVTKHPLSIHNCSCVRQDLNVFPNPSNSICTIQVNTPASEQAEITITNINGTEVCKFVTATNQPYNIKPDWPTGFYIINAATEHEHFTSNLVIQ